MSSAQDELVVSGMSGRFPAADNIAQLWDNLINGVDMVTTNSDRWPADYFGLPPRSGIIKDLSRYDAQFFGLSEQQALGTPPSIRLLHEVVYEAICDAGE